MVGFVLEGSVRHDALGGIALGITSGVVLTSLVPSGRTTLSSVVVLVNAVGIELASLNHCRSEIVVSQRSVLVPAALCSLAAVIATVAATRIFSATPHSRMRSVVAVAFISVVPIVSWVHSPSVLRPYRTVGCNGLGLVETPRLPFDLSRLVALSILMCSPLGFGISRLADELEAPSDAKSLDE